MDLNLTPTTELEAINALLDTIGESPINKIEDDGLVDAVKARAQLRNTSRRVQAKGWHWNTDPALVLPRSFPSGEVRVPLNTLKVDTVGPSAGIDVVQRGVRLYDRQRSTYSFDGPLTVSLVTMLPFEELPEAARQYITLSASRSFSEKSVGSSELSRFATREELMALGDLMNAEGDNADANILDQFRDYGGVLAR